MSKTKGKTAKKAKKVDLSASLVSAINEGDLANVKKLLRSYDLSCCECGNGSYLLLFIAIKLGHTKIAEFLLQKDAKANCETDNVTTPLHLAAKQRFARLVQSLLEKNAPVDARNSKKETPLHLAAEAGYADIVEVLLSNNASITAQTNEGATPLFLAAKARHEILVQTLLEHARVNLKDSTKTKNSILNQALLCNPSLRDKVHNLVVSIVTQDNGQSKIVDELVNHGFTLSRKFLNESLLLAAINKNYTKLLNSILNNRANLNIAEDHPQLLHAAVKIGRIEMAETFLKSGFDANATDEEGKTAINYSLNSEKNDNYVGIIWLLLTYGADITQAPDLLHKAVTNELIEVCEVLIDNCADVNARDPKGRTPLFLAVSKGRSSVAGARKSEVGNQIDKTTRHKIIELLLNRGADVNINVNSSTAFHQAVESGRKRVVSILLEWGIDVDIRAEDGPTALFYAAGEGDAEMVEFLCENNADVNGGLREISPLCIATRRLRPKVIETLLKYGATNINFDIIDDVNLNYSSDTDCDWYHDDYCTMKFRLMEHALKLKVAGFHVSEQDYDDDDDRDHDDYCKFEEKCVEEFNKLKKIKLNSQFTLADVLVNGVNPRCVKEKSLMQKLESFNLDEFPQYKNLISSSIRKSKFKLELLQSGPNWLDVLIKTSNKLNGKKYLVLPVEILEEIVSYLSYSEIKSLISCGKILKHQLSH